MHARTQHRIFRRPSGTVLRHARLTALAAAGFLLPWSAWLAATLPGDTRVRHWGVAWAGLDVGEAIAALATARLLAHEDPRSALPAAAGGALLVADAWLDVSTSAPGRDRARALAEAIGVELPLATAAFWLAATLTRGCEEHSREHLTPNSPDIPAVTSWRGHPSKMGSTFSSRRRFPADGGEALPVGAGADVQAAAERPA